MKVLSMPLAIKRRRLLRLNILLGLAVFVIATYLMATGHYENYLERRAADALYTKFAIGGLLYVAATWMFCVLSKPFWFPKRNRASQ